MGERIATAGVRTGFAMTRKFDSHCVCEGVNAFIGFFGRPMAAPTTSTKRICRGDHWSPAFDYLKKSQMAAS